MNQEEIPKNILIISDMEFDSCARGQRQRTTACDAFLLKSQRDIKKKDISFQAIVFWNVNSRTNTIPMKQNELGVALISGFSTSRAKMVMSEELDPYKCLINQLNTERYKHVEDIYMELQKEREIMHKTKDA